MKRFHWQLRVEVMAFTSLDEGSAERMSRGALGPREVSVSVGKRDEWGTGFPFSINGGAGVVLLSTAEQEAARDSSGGRDGPLS
jgi:hypothetical protein